MKDLQPLMLSGREVLPLVEGGKGIAVSNGMSSGAWAAAGGVGTFSCVNPDSYDENGNIIPQVYSAATRSERQKQLIDFAIRGGVAQAKIAHETASGAGRLHMNVLWEAGGTEPILRGVLDQVRDLVHGITCGAGMPYKVAEIAADYGIHYYPIISSARAFRALWKRAYHKHGDLLGGVVYEDPWRAGGHNGLSNSEDPNEPQDPFPRVLALRKTMREAGLDNVPILMAGGVWYLRDWEEWIGNPDLGPIAFQYGTRPLLTQESPIPDDWKKLLVTLSEGDVLLQRFSPTGFYSSAVRNTFIRELEARNARQVAYLAKPDGALDQPLPVGARGRPVYLSAADKARAEAWIAEGYGEALKTPDSTLVFVTADKSAEILKDQTDCMGCLSSCLFSNFSENEAGSTGKKADPRSFCIQKTLQDISHGGPIENNLMFAGHAACRFSSDPFYTNGFVPTVKQLIERICTGD
ncbi:nitronate monooxygenase family protein [Magnetospira sp. QH-2]|uniref:NAD(P)H-dependent flavin oxidoreductase n=1 Tax=Magnetospira sp. (strain QH-2) TaxID=1288970 RepID=UPI0003E8166E|nr:nitronate monooxygenase [Magnetospira sp. QH-2]CCQ75724.1 putative nitropropane dioxygenase [Magnetospira sp. QH-2]